MFKRNAIRIGSQTFFTTEELRNILQKNAQPDFALDKLEDMLRQKADWNGYFQAESVLNQHPYYSNYPDHRNDGLAIGYYGFNSEPYNHWFKIKDMLLCELLLAELDLIESIKYSSFSMTAIPVLSSYYAEKNSDLDISIYNKLIKNCSVRKGINDTNLNQPFFQMNATFPYKTASDGNRRRSITAFLSSHENFLEDFGLYKTQSSRYKIPLYELYLYYVMYCFYKRFITWEQLVYTNNTHIAKITSTPPVETINYRIISYKNNIIFRLQKLNLLARYFSLFTSTEYIDKFKKAFPSIAEPVKFVKDTFFNSDFVNQYIMSDWNDCYIFVRHIIDYTIISKESGYPLRSFKEELQKLARFIGTPFHLSLETFYMAMLKKDFCLFENNLNHLESYILMQLDQNPYYTEFYGTTNYLLTEVNFINDIMNQISFESRIFSESLY